MKWEHETWRKLYVRLTAAWLALPLSARGLADELLKYADDDGVIPVANKDPGAEIFRLTSAHLHERKRVTLDLAVLLRDGFIVQEHGKLIIRNLKVAQERTGSAARMAKKRERDRARDREKAEDPSQQPPNDTSPDASPVASQSDGSRARGSVPFRVVPIPPEGPPAESGFDLAHRLWLELWGRRWGEPYRVSTNTGTTGDLRILSRLGSLAAAHGERAELELRGRIESYLADPRQWLSQNRHPLHVFEQDWNKYAALAKGDPEVDALRSRSTTPETYRFPTDAQIAARLQKLAPKPEGAANG